MALQVVLDIWRDRFMVLETEIGQVPIESNLKQFLVVLSVSLGVATLPQIFSFFRQIPYTLLLVVVGLGLAFFDVRLVYLSPDLILFIFLPPILFEAAWNLEWSRLKHDLVPSLLYAVLGVVISIAGVALALKQLPDISLTTVLLVGACLAATDSVSVISLFRELGVEKRLTTLMEGESLFNDGVAAVAFGLLMGLALGTDKFEISTTLARFLSYVGIGIATGSLIGFGSSYLTQRLDLPLVERSITLISAYGSYLLTEELGGSGFIGVAIAGLILGNFGSRIGMNPRTRLAVTEFWDFLAFFVNSILFLLIGDQVSFARLTGNLGTAAVAIGAVILARAIAIYGLGSLSNWLVNSQISWQQQTVLWWGGLRGSVSIALALSVPVTLAEREEIIGTVFGVVLFTLLIQGLTTKPLLKKLQLLSDQSLRQKYLEAIARRVALNRVLSHLSPIGERLEIEPEFYRVRAALLQSQLNCIQAEINQLQNQYPQLRSFAIEQLQEELAAIEVDTYTEFIRAGLLNNTPLPLVEEIFKDENENIVN